MATTENVRWVALLGSQSYGNPIAAGGRVYVGTNNDVPRDPRFQGDRSALYCLDAGSGALLWQLNVPKLGTVQVSDWEFVGLCSSPAVEGDRLWVLTNRGELACLDVDGLADGNDGPFQDEGRYLAGPGNEPMELAATDADILWLFDMIAECGVRPHNITSSSPCLVGDRVWVATSNGVDVDHAGTPAPDAPSLIVVDKDTGALVGVEASGLGRRILHASWTSPAYLRTDSLELAVFGGPDGWIYAFEPDPVPGEDGVAVLEEAWRCDANKPEYRVDEEGNPRRYATREGPSEVVATPIVWDGKVYAAIGQDPDHGSGVGRLVCIDPSGEGDVSRTHVLWDYDRIHRSLSTPAVWEGLLFTADLSGFVYCLDARTGEEHWVHDTMAHIWGSPLVADGKVYIGNEDGFLTILPATPEYAKERVIEVDMRSPMYSSPIAADGVLYVALPTHLYAVEESDG
jgi:outer membrane protein assembly factor BamB